jgi:hypothetical protein
MHFLNYVNRLQKRGLQAKYIKELTGVGVEPNMGKAHRRLSERQLDVCLNAAKRDNYGLLRILDIFPTCNPNTIYRHIKAHVQPFNANETLKELIVALIRDGVPISEINVLIKPLVDTPLSYSVLTHLASGIGRTRSELSFNQRQVLMIEIIKYIEYKGIARDYRGYFLLKAFFLEAESRVIASAIVKSIDHAVKACNICGSEFIATKNVLFCDKCRKRRRAV